MSLTGFDADELDDLLAVGGTAEPEDETPEIQAVTVTQPGDIWEMGGHRLGCSDSTDPVAVALVLKGQTPVLMVTDPPYGVQYDATWRTEAKRNRKASKREAGVVLNDNRSDWRAAWCLFHGPVAYVWHSGVHSARVAESLLVSGLEIRSQIIWVKNNIAVGRGHYHWRHESCWYAVRKGATANWQGDRKQSTVWEINNLDVPSGDAADSTEGHSTQKPVECMRRPILNHTNQHDLCYDPFMGSGATLIAAETTGRRAYGLEINPSYVDMAVRRWQAFTGKPAHLVGDGRTFEEIQRCRVAAN
jgi:DNA modification methylase